MRKLVLATGNPGKRREMAALLEPLGIELLLQSDFGCQGVEETGLTFVENALLKARAAAAASGLPAVADDSGLEVDALRGEPGIHSARFAGPGAADADNNALLLERLEGVAEARRTARYQTVIVMLEHEHDPTPVICEGRWEGRILEGPRGEGGFGYDPLFLPAGGEITAAELDPAEKNRISHRGRAMARLRERLEGWA